MNIQYGRLVSFKHANDHLLKARDREEDEDGERRWREKTDEECEM